MCQILAREGPPEGRAFLAFMAIIAALFIHIGMSLYAGVLSSSSSSESM
ncbi:MAG: hypothetical protein L0387_10935 [Acidobacteria bacterium]|nr:hypothetical protein [Acidobacteriota bacterium]